MAKPMTLEQIKHQFDLWGVEYNIVGDPTKHRRDPEHGSWGPVYGTGIHHTGDDAPDTSDRRVISDGRADLAGPLAQFGVPDNGIIDIHSIGRSNHFGGGDPDVLAAVKNESYQDYPPKTDKHQGEAGSVDGNPHFYGFETYYSGSHRMTDKAYRALVLANAAIDHFHGWTCKSNIGHKEWSDWKVDPGFLDMKIFRADVAAALAAGPSGARERTVSKPVHATPHITAALQANVQYRKALAKIKSKAAGEHADSIIHQLKDQHKILQDLERKPS